MEKFRGQHLSTVDFVLLPYLDQQDLRMSEEVEGLRFLYTFFLGGGRFQTPFFFFVKEEGGMGGYPPMKRAPRGNPRG